MFDSIYRDIKQQFSHGNALTKIILVNIGFFVFVNLVRIILLFVDGQAPPPSYTPFIQFFAISKDLLHTLTHPWVILTHIFLHEGFWHIFWNMLLLYWFGRIVGDLLGDRRVLPIYLICGLAGGFTYLAVANLPSLWSFGEYALGASAAVMGMLAVAGMTAPSYLLHLLLIGPVRLKYVVLVLIFLDLIALSWNSSSGGSIAHLGGTVMGFVIASQLQRGNDLTSPVANGPQALQEWWQNRLRTNRKPKVVFRNNQKGPAKRPGPSRHKHSDLDEQAKVDAILDKIKEKGYDSLTKEEKEFLFNASNK